MTTTATATATPAAAANGAEPPRWPQRRTSIPTATRNPWRFTKMLASPQLGRHPERPCLQQGRASSPPPAKAACVAQPQDTHDHAPSTLQQAHPPALSEAALRTLLPLAILIISSTTPTPTLTAITSTPRARGLTRATAPPSTAHKVSTAAQRVGPQTHCRHFEMVIASSPLLTPALPLSQGGPVPKHPLHHFSTRTIKTNRYLFTTACSTTTTTTTTTSS